MPNKLDYCEPAFRLSDVRNGFPVPEFGAQKFANFSNAAPTPQNLIYPDVKQCGAKKLSAPHKLISSIAPRPFVSRAIKHVGKHQDYSESIFRQHRRSEEIKLITLRERCSFDFLNYEPLSGGATLRFRNDISRVIPAIHLKGSTYNCRRGLVTNRYIFNCAYIVAFRQPKLMCNLRCLSSEFHLCHNLLRLKREHLLRD